MRSLSGASRPRLFCLRLIQPPCSSGRYSLPGKSSCARLMDGKRWQQNQISRLTWPPDQITSPLPETAPKTIPTQVRTAPKDGGTGEYMAEVRISSRFERPCAVVEDPRDALADAGEREPRHRKVHSLIDKVYDPNNLEEAWQRVWENRGSAGTDGVTIAAFAEREDD